MRMPTLAIALALVAPLSLRSRLPGGRGAEPVVAAQPAPRVGVRLGHLPASFDRGLMLRAMGAMEGRR